MVKNENFQGKHKEESPRVNEQYAYNLFFFLFLFLFFFSQKKKILCMHTYSLTDVRTLKSGKTLICFT